MQKIQPCLWFDGNAEEAVQFYTSVFRNSEILNTTYYGEEMHLPAGTVLTITFRIEGQEFMALNGGPQYKFNPAISLMVSCQNQAEIDELWEKLTADGGAPVQCGWLTDRFGLSWQIVPAALGEMMQNPAKFHRVLGAVMQMTKLDLAAMQAAYAE